MTPKQFDLVATGYRTVLSKRERFSDAFFDQLFELDPEFRDLFEGGFQDRTNWLITSMGILVANINSAGCNGRLPAGNGARYTILDVRYFTVGAALLWALEDSLGGLFSPAMEEAWAAAFHNYSAGMFPTFDAMSEAA
jgi:hemoglobin-like flavoprotein